MLLALKMEEGGFEWNIIYLFDEAHISWINKDIQIHFNIRKLPISIPHEHKEIFKKILLN